MYKMAYARTWISICEKDVAVYLPTFAYYYITYGVVEALNSLLVISKSPLTAITRPNTLLNHMHVRLHTRAQYIHAFIVKLQSTPRITA